MKYLKQIAPKWDRKIKSGNIAPDKLNLRDTTTCIVGEAYGWTGIYDPFLNFSKRNCHDCARFAIRFWRGGVNVEADKRFIQDLDDFIIHWNIRHV